MLMLYLISPYLDYLHNNKCLQLIWWTYVMIFGKWNLKNCMNICNRRISPGRGFWSKLLLWTWETFNFFEALFLHVWNKGLRVNNPFNLISFEILRAYASASQMNMDVVGNLIVLICFVLKVGKEIQDK